MPPRRSQPSEDRRLLGDTPHGIAEPLRNHDRSCDHSRRREDPRRRVAGPVDVAAPKFREGRRISRVEGTERDRQPQWQSPQRMEQSSIGSGSDTSLLSTLMLKRVRREHHSEASTIDTELDDRALA